jgi:large repetitive protein
VTSVRTGSGPEAGGNSVDIFGTGFKGSTAVSFGGVPAASFSVVSDYEIRATAPAYSPTGTTCAQDGSSFGETAVTDVCQTEVVVSNAQGPSAQSTILPLYEGSEIADALGQLSVPPGDEAAPQPTEYDYLPTPTITSISTSAGPAEYASELGGSLVTLNGYGFNAVGLEWVAFGDPTQEVSQDFSIVSITGTQVQILAPPLPITSDATTLPVTVGTTAGVSAAVYADYAGLPDVSSVMATRGASSGGPDTGGTPIVVSGAGFGDTIGIQFADAEEGFSFGSQYNFTVHNDDSIGTTTVAQNPGLVDVQVCTMTGCSLNPPKDHFILYAPGAPDVTSVTPSSGRAAGGAKVIITGRNLGCVTGVTFGTMRAKIFSNPPSLLDCGSTVHVYATVPALPRGAKLPLKVEVKVTTIESRLTGNAPVTTATFTYVSAVHKS